MDMGTFREGGFGSIGPEDEHVKLCWPQVAWCCGELLVIVSH